MQVQHEYALGKRRLNWTGKKLEQELTEINVNHAAHFLIFCPTKESHTHTHTQTHSTLI